MIPSVGTYTGPGDIVTFDAWWGLRGYTATYAGGGALAKALDLNTTADDDLVTVLLNSNGTLNTSGLPDLGTHKISKLYDQTGGGLHLVQATHANRPTLNTTGTYSIIFVAASASLTIGSGLSGALPWSYSTVASVPITANSGSIMWDGNGDHQFEFNADASVILRDGGTSMASAAASITANTDYSLHALFNGASSSLIIDATTPVTGTLTGARAAGTLMGPAVTTRPCSVLELGARNSDISSFFGALNTNQHAFWGY